MKPLRERLIKLFLELILELGVLFIAFFVWFIILYGVEMLSKSINSNLLSELIIRISLFSLFVIWLYLEKNVKKLFLISKDKFFVEEKNSMVLVKYIGKCEFLIKKSLIDVNESDFEKDIVGNSVSFFDRERVFLSFKNYKDRRDSKNDIAKNKKILCELSVNSLGIREADDYEIKELSERIKINRWSILIVCVVCLLACLLPALLGIKDFYMIKLFANLSVFWVFFSIIFCSYFMRLRSDKDIIYLIMECIICDKKKVRRGRSRTVYKIRCEDRNRIYINNWFECAYGTYHKDIAKIVVAKQKNGKVYINSFDKLWSSHSYIVKA